MRLASDWQRLKAISWRDRLLLAEAATALAAAALAIRLLPFRTVVGRDEGLSGSAAATSPQQAWRQIDRVHWAIQAAARRLPLRLVCFQKGLALHRMLHRRGIASELHYGVAQGGERGLSAHVWVTYGGRDVIGGEEAPRFTRLATFPAGSRC